MNRSVVGLALGMAMSLGHGLAGEAPSKVLQHSVKGDPYANESVEQRDARMAWWREAKFGMFIHWGVYAVPAGEHEGVHDAEWIMRKAEIPVARYREYAKGFTGENFDPDAWVKLAQQAGMRYMVLTAKHHDGFALYPTQVSDWNIMAATPFKKDAVGMLAKAARDRGMKFGLYYSHSQDWVNPGGAKWRIEEGGGWDPAHKGSYDTYLDQTAVPQVREILAAYHPDVLWWDTPHYMTPERGEKLIKLLELSPGIIHNDRLGGGYHGDTITPENFIPPTGYPGKDWETCMTTNDNWGYVRDDHQWKTLDEVVGNLVDIVSKGGNYLLNVGPDATGKFPDEAVTLLQQVGTWMKINGEAIYGTHASPFACRLPWGRCTTKMDGENSILYLHVLDWPVNDRLLLPGLKNEVLSAVLLADEIKLQVEDSPFGPYVLLPKIRRAADSVSTTLKLRLKGQPVVETLPVLADPDGVMRLTPGDAVLNGKLKLEQSFGVDRIGHWEDATDSISWRFIAGKTGKFRVKLIAAAEAEGQVIKISGVGEFGCDVPKVERMKRDLKTIEAGGVELQEGKTYTVNLHAVPEGWQSVNVFGLNIEY